MEVGIMKKEDLIKLGLTEEQAEKVAEASAEELKGFIPKSRFDEVNEAKKKLEEELKNRDEQLEELKKIDAEGLKAQIEKLQKENQDAKKQYEAELSQVRLNNAIEMALVAAKAKNIKAVKALLDLSKIKLDGENLIGFKEQVDVLKQADDSKFLFEETQSSPQFKGLKPGESFNDDASVIKNPWSKEHFNLTEQGRIYRENPELAKQLQASANLSK